MFRRLLAFGASFSLAVQFTVAYGGDLTCRVKGHHEAADVDYTVHQDDKIIEFVINDEAYDRFTISELNVDLALDIWDVPVKQNGKPKVNDFKCQHEHLEHAPRPLHLNCSLPDDLFGDGEMCGDIVAAIHMEALKTPRPNKKHLTLCENRDAKLWCAKGKEIRVTYANYGRTDRKTCRKRGDVFDSESPCLNSEHTGRLKMECDGKRQCKVWSRDSFWGDTCEDASEYLEVDYECVAPHERGLTLCENRDARLRCPWGTEIEITHANYGRTDGETCPHEYIKDENCTDSTHTDRLRDDCNGRRLCRVWARNRFWGDTCPGTYKYLDIDYRCADYEWVWCPGYNFPRTNKATYTKITIPCRECGLKDVTCRTKEVPATIDDAVANVDYDINFDDRAVVITIDDTQTGFEVLKALVEVGFDLADIPNSGAIENSVVCEDRDRDIRCSSGNITIVSANYGRTDDTTCAEGTAAAYLPTDCTNGTHTERLKTVCDGLKKCTVWARDSFWGKTCDAPKYLDVHYRCGDGHPNKDKFKCKEEYPAGGTGSKTLSCPLPDEVQEGFCGDILVATHLTTKSGKAAWCPAEEFPLYQNATYTKVPVCKCDDATSQPTPIATDSPTDSPTPQSTGVPTDSPTPQPTGVPTDSPTPVLTNAPTPVPEVCEDEVVEDDLECTTGDDQTVALIDVSAFFDDQVLQFAIDDRDTVFDVVKASVAIGFEVDDVPTHTSHNLILCENNDAKIKCPADEEIEIIHANYGRTEDGTICPHESIMTINCTDGTHTETLANACDGKNECRVWSRNSFWGDTCPGTFKYLDVDYDCVGGDEPTPQEFDCMGVFDPVTPIKKLNCSLPEEVGRDFCDDLVVAVHLRRTKKVIENSVVCEDRDRDIRCGRGTITIVSANYGRTDDTTCAEGTAAAYLPTDCTNGTHTERLKTVCDGLEKCTVWARDSFWGKTCDAPKYLDVHYRCEEESWCPGEVFPDADATYTKIRVCGCEDGNDDETMEYGF